MTLNESMKLAPASYPTTSDISMLMSELGFKWSNDAQIYYDYNFNLIPRKAADRIYRKLLGDNPYSPVGIPEIIVSPDQVK